MRILHYSLGLPPFRSGGLTKYSFDLMKNQIEEGHEVYLLYPGYFNFSRKTKIIKNKNKFNSNIYEIVNPLPVSLLGGVVNPMNFCNACDENIYFNFLKKVKPTIIHIHTLMGLHKEFLEVAKKMKIKIVYTTHDYYGFCPKGNLLDNENRICTDFENGFKCAVCNENSYSMKLIYLMQSNIYRKFKNSTIIKKARILKKKYLKTKISNNSIAKVKCSGEDYEKLRQYYLKMFKLIDYFHFNSTLTKELYNNYIKLKGEVINISHADIRDNRIKKSYNDNMELRITYLGPTEAYKGFYMLKNALDKLIYKKVFNWHLDVYGNDNIYYKKTYEKFIAFNGSYDYYQLKDIFDNTDLLIVPSIWNETFGYIALEGISYGVPTIVTENVGSKDIIINNKTGFIIKSSIDELSNKLEEVIKERKILSDINKNILNQGFSLDMYNHSKKINEFYKRVLD
ncbi:glycosyl transferase family 1 [Clostridium sporogenes]